MRGCWVCVEGHHLGQELDSLLSGCGLGLLCWIRGLEIVWLEDFMQFSKLSEFLKINIKHAV